MNFSAVLVDDAVVLPTDALKVPNPWGGEWDDGKRETQKVCVILAVILGVLLLAAGIFFSFTPVGYRMTVPYRHFTEIQENVYIDNSYRGDRETAMETVNAAADRVSAFWGNRESRPIIIISDDEKTLAKLGGDHDTSTVVFFRAYSYVVLSDRYLQVDVLAHEWTHAELHARLYQGKLPQTLVPTWFDEGVATQNDYREQYSEEAWAQATDNGRKHRSACGYGYSGGVLRRKHRGPKIALHPKQARGQELDR